MSEPPSQSTEYVCAYVLRYADRTEGQVLHRGSKEDCERTADMAPAIAISGPRPEHGASVVVAPAAEWDDACE